MFDQKKKAYEKALLSNQKGLVWCTFELLGLLAPSCGGVGRGGLEEDLGRGTVEHILIPQTKITEYLN